MLRASSIPPCHQVAFLSRPQSSTIASVFATRAPSPVGRGAGGSRVTHVAGQAAYQAALALQQQPCEVAAGVLGCTATAVTLDNGVCVVHSAPNQRLTLAEVAAAAPVRQRPWRAQKLYRVSQYPHMTSFTAQIVEVEVDPETGQVTLLDVVTAHDVSTISPVPGQSERRE